MQMYHTWARIIPFMYRTIQICFAGYCFGTNVGTSASPSAEDCLIRCKGNDECKWFTYQSDERICALTSDCLFVDETCGGDCVHGRKYCQLEEDGEKTGSIYCL